MFNNFYNLDHELTKSIENVLNSDFSSKELSEFCNVSYTTINELRSGKRDINNSGLHLCLKLYRFALNNNLADSFFVKESRKGNSPYVTLLTSMDKIFVSFNREDLFAYGMFKPNHSTSLGNPNKLETIYPSDAVFVTKDGTLLECSDFGFQFKCRYGGTGPHNFLDFLKQYSTISEEELKEVIFSSDVVEYDFESDQIIGHPSKIPGGAVDFYWLNGKLIIKLNNYDNSIYARRNPRQQEPTLESAASDIIYLATVLESQYNLSSELKDVLYVPRNSSDSRYTLYRGGLRFSNDIHIALQFDSYEIWLPYSIHQNKGDIFTNPEFSQFLNDLGIEYVPEKKGILTSFLAVQNPITDIQRLNINNLDESEY